jgi:hypothetical protein
VHTATPWSGARSWRTNPAFNQRLIEKGKLSRSVSHPPTDAESAARRNQPTDAARKSISRRLHEAKTPYAVVN